MNSITLTCFGVSKTLDADKLESYQIDLVRGYVNFQITKIRNRILHKKLVPAQAMIKLQQRLSMLIGILAVLARYGKRLNQS